MRLQDGVLNMIYFTADTHFCHSNIIGLCKRPFTDVAEMNETLITNWNAYITDRDEVYFLGDFAFKGSIDEVNRIIRRLKGKKYLIHGNHDYKYLKDNDFVNAFEWNKDYHTFNYKDAWFVLFHYPILEWEHYYRKSVHLYGHVHNAPVGSYEEAERFAVLGNRAFNVGVDANNYFPISADVIYSRAFEQ